MKANRVSALALILAPPLFLAACVPAAAPPRPLPPPAPAAAPPPPAPRLPAPPPPAPDWADRPQTPGGWRWSMARGQSSASYIDPAGTPLLSLTCQTASHAILFTRAGAGEGFTLTTKSASRLIPGATLPASDSFLDAIAFNRGRFMVEATGVAPLYLPSWPEVSRVVEDCR